MRDDVARGARPVRTAWSAVRGAAAEEQGQSTLEYLLVLVGTVAVVVGLYALVRLGENGVLARLATGSASHAVGGDDPVSGLLDVLMY